MREFFSLYVIPNFNFWISVILMMIGLYAMITKNNLIKKLIGMSIFQTAIILFFVSTGAKEGATIPILEHHPPALEQAGAAPAEADAHAIDPDRYANPLPHVLMLTAIVVGVAILGVALAVAQVIYKNFGTLEEDELLSKIKAAENNG